MMKKFLFLLAFFLSACSSHEPDPISLSQHNRYQAAAKIQHLVQLVRAQGLAVYVQGDKYEIIIPAAFLFKNLTPQLSDSSTPIFGAIINLINAQDTGSVEITAYANVLRKPSLNKADSQWNFSLSQSWANTIRDQLHQQGLKVGLLYTNANGECDNTGKDNHYSNRIEIHYRTSHET